VGDAVTVVMLSMGSALHVGSTDFTLSVHDADLVRQQLNIERSSVARGTEVARQSAEAKDQDGSDQNDGDHSTSESEE
jgi:hypothetical protein